MSLLGDENELIHYIEIHGQFNESMDLIFPFFRDIQEVRGMDFEWHEISRSFWEHHRKSKDFRHHAEIKYMIKTCPLKYSEYKGGFR